MVLSAGLVRVANLKILSFLHSCEALLDLELAMHLLVRLHVLRIDQLVLSHAPPVSTFSRLKHGSVCGRPRLASSWLLPAMADLGDPYFVGLKLVEAEQVLLVGARNKGIALVRRDHAHVDGLPKRVLPEHRVLEHRLLPLLPLLATLLHSHALVS